MRLGIIGAIALALGIWVVAHSWWLIAEVIEALVALGLVVGGALAIAITIRRMHQAKAPQKGKE